MMMMLDHDKVGAATGRDGLISPAHGRSSYAEVFCVWLTRQRATPGGAVDRFVSEWRVVPTSFALSDGSIVQDFT